MSADKKILSYLKKAPKHTMQDAPIIFRNFSGSDAFMLNEARVNQSLLQQDLPAFTAFDATLNAAWSAAYLADIVAAETIIADTAVIDQQVQTGENVDAIIVAARNKYSEIKYYVQKAPEFSVGMQGEFGLNDYDTVRRSKVRMAQFLDEMHDAATKYKVQLIARGYTQAKIDQIQTLRQSLLAAMTAKGTFTKGRPKLTEDRINLLNKVYDKMTQVNTAAQLVYLTDAAKRAQFVYEPTGDTEDYSEYTGAVPAGAEQTVATVPYEPTRELTFRNTGVAPLQFFLTNGSGASGEVISIGGGAEVVRTMEQMLVDGNAIVVKNMDGTQAGAYLVEVEVM